MPDSKQMDEWNARFKQVIPGVWRTDTSSGPVQSVTTNTYRADGTMNVVIQSQITNGPPMAIEYNGTWSVEAVNNDSFLLSAKLADAWPLPEQMRLVDENTIHLSVANRNMVRIGGGRMFGPRHQKAENLEKWTDKHRKFVLGTWRSRMAGPSGEMLVTATYRDNGRIDVETVVSNPGAPQQTVNVTGTWRVEGIADDRFRLFQEFGDPRPFYEEVHVIDEKTLAVATGQRWERTQSTVMRPIVQSYGGAANEDRVKRILPGNWRHETTTPPYRMVVTSTYRADGTFTQTTRGSVPGSETMESTLGGTWRVTADSDDYFVLWITMHNNPNAPSFMKIIDDNTLGIPGLTDRIERVGGAEAAHASPAMLAQRADDLTTRLVGEWENRKQQGKVTNLERWTFGPDKTFRLQRTVVFGEVRTESPVETGSWRVDPGKPHGNYLALRWSTGESHTIEIELKDPKTLYSLDDKETYVKVR